jgi:hypothetical protein
LLGATGVWPQLSAQVRVGVEAVEPADFKKMREMGLGVLYGAVLEGGRVYTGPLAVALDGVLLREQGCDVVLLEGEAGEVLWRREATAEDRVLGGIVSDIRDLLRLRAGGEEEEVWAEVSGEAHTRCFVRLPLGRREAVLANVDDVMDERMDGEGMWQAVVRGISIAQLRLLASEGLAIPVAGEWSAAASAGLRLVG